MNTFMYEHPVTQPQLDVINKWGIKIVKPVEKVLACGDKGTGGLASIEEITNVVKEAVKEL